MRAHRSHLVHNASSPRAELRELPWDERQVVNEHETFFVEVQRAGWAVGYDLSVRVRHHYARSEVHAQQPAKQDNPVPGYLPQLPAPPQMGHAVLDPRLRRAHFTSKTGAPSSLEWGATDDASTAEYRPAKV